MDRIYDYQRIQKTSRIRGSIVDLGNAGFFSKVKVNAPENPEESIVGESVFKCIHVIESPGEKRILSAYRNDGEPGVLLIVWNGFPYYSHIEQGGDFMLQFFSSDREASHLIIDNTYVLSGWMNEKMTRYLDNGWFPGLIELGLETFCHLQAESYLGGVSFEEFGRHVSVNIDNIARKLGKSPFIYNPIRTSDMNPVGLIDEMLRDKALNKVMEFIRSYIAAAQ